MTKTTHFRKHFDVQEFLYTCHFYYEDKNFFVHNMYMYNAKVGLTRLDAGTQHHMHVLVPVLDGL